MFDTGQAADQARVSQSPAAIARQVLDDYWDGMTLPINPGKIAQDMGITLRVMAEDSPYSGAIWYTDDGLPVIEYKRSELLTRRRFTVAHEIGHFMLQHG
ncbi:MAG: hypothetical protein RIQ53_4775, partial [Pseudomonadota bacterium]